MHACFDCIHMNVFRKKCEIAACIINLRGLYRNLTGYNNKIKITWCLEINWISAGLPAGLQAKGSNPGWTNTQAVFK